MIEELGTQIAEFTLREWFNFIDALSCSSFCEQAYVEKGLLVCPILGGSITLDVKQNFGNNEVIFDNPTHLIRVISLIKRGENVRIFKQGTKLIFASYLHENIKSICTHNQGTVIKNKLSDELQDFVLMNVTLLKKEEITMLKLSKKLDKENYKIVLDSNDFSFLNIHTDFDFCDPLKTQFGRKVITYTTDELFPQKNNGSIQTQIHVFKKLDEIKVKIVYNNKGLITEFFPDIIKQEINPEFQKLVDKLLPHLKKTTIEK